MTSSPLAVCFGTRPQVIKASALIRALEHDWPLLTVDTGQHYDYELHRLLYEQLDVPAAQHCLDVREANPARQLSQIIARAADVLEREHPWAVVVLGDTNSTLGCALAAAQLRIPIIHVEAGLRASNLSMLEEVARRAVDAMATLLCTPSDTATARLEREHADGTVVQTGDIARDVLNRIADQTPPLRTFEWWPIATTDAFVFATLHRAELTGNPGHLRQVMDALSRLELPVILPAHPRLRAALHEIDAMPVPGGSVHVLEPRGYVESIACVQNASVVVTDSGGVQREAYWLGTPCITLRSETEWVETLALGANILLPPERSANELAALIARWSQQRVRERTWNRDAYGRGDAAARIRTAISQLAAELGLARSATG